MAPIPLSVNTKEKWYETLRRAVKQAEINNAIVSLTIFGNKLLIYPTDTNESLKPLYNRLKKEARLEEVNAKLNK